jgi:hypothetical protein
MNSPKALAIALLAAFAALPGCRDSNPVESRAAEASIGVPAFSTSSAGSTYRMPVHDDYAAVYASSWDEGRSRHISVFVSRAGPGPDAHASLSIYGSECTQTGPEWWDYVCTDFSGWGIIPAKDVTGNFGSGLAVHTDLRNNPDFWLWGADPGIVSVTWQRTGWSETRNSGSSESRWGHFVSRQSGTRRSSSATATGEVLGVSLTESNQSFRDGHLSTGRGVTLSFERVAGN